MTNKIDEHTIMVVPSMIKNKVIVDVREKYGMIDIKFMDLQEFRNHFYFSYDKKTILYLMNKYGYKYDVCLSYLKCLYFIEDKEYSFNKLSFLRDLKKKLDDNNLLIYDKVFVDSLRNKKVLLYGFDFIDKFYIKMFEDVSNYCKLEIIDKEYNHYNSDIYELKTLEEEVNFVCIKILELINSGVDINKIKISNINEEYYNTIIRIFNFYNIPIYLERKVSLYSTTMGRYFINNYKEDIGSLLKELKDNYKEDDIYNKIVDIINEYSFCESYFDVLDMVIYELKHSYITENKRVNQIECIDIINNDIDDDIYVFLMNFNQGSIPIIKKDEDYITDKMIEEVNYIESTIDYNKRMKNTLIKCISNIKNLIISYKLEGDNGSYTISNLNDILEYDIIKDFRDNYKYSNIYNKLRLSSYIDDYIKYGIDNDWLNLLYSHYPNIEYMKYDNKFKGINKDKLKEFLGNELTLSYTYLDNFYRCGFKYYLTNILRINIYEDKFLAIIGSLFHYVLSFAFSDNFNLDECYYEYINELDREFSAKEMFFLYKLKDELRFIISTINEQLEYSELGKSLYEKEILVDKSRDIKITFKGIIDKIIYDNIDDMSIVSIIDYKTGNVDIKINNTIYGIDMQLPVYIYLIKNSDIGKSNLYIAGFYLQKILHNEIVRDNKNTYESLKKKELRLEGYSNEDINILKYFDSSYADSKVVKSLKITNSGDFYVHSKVLNNDKIDKLVDIVDKNIECAIDRILEGEFNINPKRIGKDNIGCKYCEFRDICYMTENDIVNLEEYKNLLFLDS